MSFKCETPISDLPENGNIQIRCTKCGLRRQTTPRELMTVGRFQRTLNLTQLERVFECASASCRSPVTFTAFGGLGDLSAA